MSARLFLVVGSAGSGKSCVARRLAARTASAYLDKDVLATGFTEALLAAAGTDPQARDGNDYYRDVVMELEYSTLWRLAATNLRLSRSVVLDAPFLRWFDECCYVDRMRAEHGLAPGLAVTVVHVHADGETVRRRLAERGLARDADKLAGWDSYWADVRDRQCSWTGVDQVTVDNTPEGEDSEDPLDALVLSRVAGVRAHR